MNTGGRRRPLGPWARGLSCCALVLAVLGLWFGAAAGTSSGTDGHGLPAVSHLVSMAQVAARPPAPDVDAVPVETIALALLLAGVLIGARWTAQPVRVRSERHQGRAPPCGLRHR